MIHKYRKNDELGDLYDLLRIAPILLIDDLGIEYGGPLFKSMIDRVVDGRIKRFPDKPTVITTNIPTQDLRNYIERTGDRLMDLARVERAFIAANSYRQIKPNIR
jgi:DNA replication protein DnaC